MPRGVPNAKKDDLGMRYTTFHAPLLANPKLTASSYLKYESQSVWARNAAARANKGRLAEELNTSEARRGSKVIVIHPGSRWLRIGRAADVVPVTIPHVIARRVRNPPAIPPTSRVFIPHTTNRKPTYDISDGRKEDEYAVTMASDDPLENHIAAVAIALRDRMRFYKLRIVPNASKVASSFNEQMTGEESPNLETFAQNVLRKDVLVGEQVFELPDEAHLKGYEIRWPIYSGRFNRRDYSSHQSMLSDVEEIWETVMKDRLGIDPKSFKEYSVVLVIPDVWDRFYVRELVDMLITTMGFKQIVCQQESVAATYGAGIPNACVIDLGAVKTSISCVEDGMILADTRLVLSAGGDDTTEFLAVLLERISFPYKELDLARMHDWLLMDDLKCRICTLSEGDVALNLYDFSVRRPGKNPVKYGLRAYDEVILAPMVVFDSRVVDPEQKRDLLRRAGHPDISDEMIEFISDQLSNAMMISTQHLMPPVPPPGIAAPSIPASGAVTPLPLETGSRPEGKNGSSKAIGEGVKKVGGQPEIIDIDADMPDAETKGGADAIPPSGQESHAQKSPADRDERSASQPDPIQASKQDTPISTVNGTPAPADAPATTFSAPGPQQPFVQPQEFIGGYSIDVPFEASKLPLDVAIYNSTRAAGGDERIRKYLQNVLVVGGGALIPGIVHALESRLQAIATPLVPNMEKVQIIPPPKDVDPRMLVWKGAAVLGKMDGVADLWVTAADWDLFGMRALKERCYYL